MRNTIPLGQLFGIKIGLHRFVPVLALGFTIIAGGANPALMGIIVLYIVVLFSLVLLHELGHSLVARHFDIKVSQITLWPLGGVAWMEEIPEDSKIEGLIAVAGPAVNLALALLAAPLLLVPGIGALAQIFILMNLMLGIFNLFPAFPMDGGRVLRAYFARKGDWLEATEKAVRVGKVLAIAGAILGLFTGRFMIPILALYIISMGQRELFAIRARKLGTGFPFGNFAEAARRARENYAKGTDTPFGFEPSGGFRPPSEFSPDTAPARSETSPASDGSRGGFSDADIAELENFRGRLRRDWRSEDT